MSVQSGTISLGLAPTAGERGHTAAILTINVGSSSLKFALFAPARPPSRVLSGRLERIGMPGSRLIVADSDGRQEETAVEAPNQAAALDLLTQLLGSTVGLENIAVIGHHVVHGGNRFHRPELLTPETAMLSVPR